MVNQHRFLKFARKVGTARTDEGQTFKKPFQTVRRPPTYHDMHDDFVRHPPNNIPEDQFGKSPEWVHNKQSRKGNVWGREGLGRVKSSDIERQLVEEDSLHS